MWKVGELKLSTSVPYNLSPEELVRTASDITDLERAGLDGVWAAEAYSFDAVSLMGFLAAKTHRIEIGSAILPIYTRSPALLAMTAAGIDALSGGRFILGIGASGPQVVEGFHGIPYESPVGRTQEIIDICHQVWRRDVLEHTGSSYQVPLPKDRGTGLGKPLKIINKPVRDRIPIYVAALGDKNVAKAAEIAEGWLPIFYYPAMAAEVFGPALVAGKSRRGPELAPLEVVVNVVVAIGDNVTHFRENVRPQIALYVGGMGARGRNFYNTLFCRYGFNAEAESIQELYLQGRKDEAAAAVPGEFLEQTSLIGPAGYVKERIAEFRESGVTNLNVTALGAEPVKVFEQLRDMID